MIGYYVHHQGAGHLTRARCIAAATDEPVTALTSLDLTTDPRPFADWVSLPRDDHPDEHGTDPTAGGALHWAPHGAPGYTERMARLAGWLGEVRPSVVVVDVSVEVTLLVRLLGVPVVVVAGAGRRDDLAHDLVHRAATAILAPWPAGVMAPEHLEPWRAKVTYAGAMSRFDGRCPVPVPVAPPRCPRAALLLVGRGGAAGDVMDLDAVRRCTPGWRWRVAGPDDWAGPEELWTLVVGSDVVVCHAGQNVLAEVAAARRPAVVVARPRPFGEQRATASALDDAGIAVGLDTWPEPERWRDLLDRAVALGGEGWARWSPGDGAARAATVLARVASGV